jgi:hypothetical protein
LQKKRYDDLQMADPVAAITSSVGTFWVAFWPAFWPAVLGALAGSGAAFGLEFLRRRREQLQQEVGKGNRLLLTLTQMLSSHEDLNEMLFERFSREEGRSPEWHEVGIMSGLPNDGPTILLAEYEFLLQHSAQSEDAPGVLNRLWILDRNYRSNLNIIHERNEWYMRFQQECPGGFTARGDEGVRGVMAAGVYIKRLNDMTLMLKTDLPETIAAARTSLNETRKMLVSRYPKSQFLHAWPKKSVAISAGANAADKPAPP